MAVKRHDDFLVAHFGLIVEKSTLIDRFTCIFSGNTLETLKDNLVQYSDEIGVPKGKITPWNPSIPAWSETTHLSFPVIDFIHLTNWEEKYAEICFWNYSHAHVADIVRSGQQEQISPWGVALVRCSIDLQRAFLKDLYEE
jgi:hypothetical protein